MKCGRTVCENKGTCKHSQNGRLYCWPCARKINEYNPMVPSLIEVPSKELLWELKSLCRTNILRTDEESRIATERKAETCLCFDEQYPEDVFDRFGHWLEPSKAGTHSH
jgi:hypothetical protein